MKSKIKVGDQEYYVDGYLQLNLNRAIEIVKKDWDMIFLYDGYEGSGKSVKAMQDAYYFDHTFNLDRVCFNPREFTSVIKSTKPHGAVIYDEAYTGLTSRAAMSLINRTLVKMLAEIRQKQLFVGIVMPTFFDLDKYVALWRSRVLIHVYIGKDYKRGFFNFYNMERKKYLYVNGKKFYNYFKPIPNFKGRFTNYYVVDEAAYRKKKRDSLLRRNSEEEEAILNELARKHMFQSIIKVKGVTHTKKAEILGMAESTYYIWLRNFNETGEI